MIKTKQFVFNELGINSFVLYDETRKCIIIDPGCNTSLQQQQLKKLIQERQTIFSNTIDDDPARLTNLKITRKDDSPLPRSMQAPLRKLSSLL